MGMETGVIRLRSEWVCGVAGLVGEAYPNAGKSWARVGSPTHGGGQTPCDTVGDDGLHPNNWKISIYLFLNQLQIGLRCK